jgi:hypothetical protein
MESRSGEPSSGVGSIVNRSDEADVTEEQDDPRVEATGRIWRMMIPVLALSIPITNLVQTHSAAGITKQAGATGAFPAKARLPPKQHDPIEAVVIAFGDSDTDVH